MLCRTLNTAAHSLSTVPRPANPPAHHLRQALLHAKVGLKKPRLWVGGGTRCVLHSRAPWSPEYINPPPRGLLLSRYICPNIALHEHPQPKQFPGSTPSCTKKLSEAFRLSEAPHRTASDTTTPTLSQHGLLPSKAKTMSLPCIRC